MSWDTTRTDSAVPGSMSWGHTIDFSGDQSMPLSGWGRVDIIIPPEDPGSTPSLLGLYWLLCLPGALPSLTPFCACGGADGIDRVAQEGQGSVPFPHWPCVSCLSDPVVCPSLVCHVCCPQLIPQENRPLFSACHFGSSLPEPCCLLLTMPTFPVPPLAPQTIQRKHLS